MIPTSTITSVSPSSSSSPLPPSATKAQRSHHPSATSKLVWLVFVGCLVWTAFTWTLVNQHTENDAVGVIEPPPSADIIPSSSSLERTRWKEIQEAGAVTEEKERIERSATTTTTSSLTKPHSPPSSSHQNYQHHHGHHHHHAATPSKKTKKKPLQSHQTTSTQSTKETPIISPTKISSLSSKGRVVDSTQPPSAAPLLSVKLRQQPRMVSYYYDDNSNNKKFEPLPLYWDLPPTQKRRKLPPREMIDISMTDWRRREASGGQDRKTKEERFEGLPYKKIPGQQHCTPLYNWQLQSFPVCNTFHEMIDMSASGMLLKQNHLFHLTVGGYRNVWKLQLPPSIATTNHHHSKRDSMPPPLALKTLKYEREYYQRQFERHRMDALTSDKLQTSANVLNIYGYCGTSATYEYANGGDLQDYIIKSRRKHKHHNPSSSRELIQLAHQIVSGVADAHNWIDEGLPWFAHADIATRQFVRTNSTTTQFKLTDFNRARLLFQNSHTTPQNKQCGFWFPNAREITRSPEEFNREVQTEKIDVYSLGNVLYEILTGHEITGTTTTQLTDEEEQELQTKIKKGLWRPPIDSIWTKKSQNDPSIRTLIESIHQCWEQEPAKRPTARQVEQNLANALRT